MRILSVGIVVCAVAAIASSAQAEVTVTATEVGGDVVFEGSGSLNLDAWTFARNVADFPKIQPNNSIVVVGPTDDSGDFYQSASNFSDPGAFGTGFMTTARRGSGALLGFRDSGDLIVPTGYVSGDPLSGSATYVEETFESLGMTVGTYTWTWGTGQPGESFTLVIGN